MKLYSSLLVIILFFAQNIRAITPDFFSQKAKVIRTLIGRNLSETEIDNFITDKYNEQNFWNKIINTTDFINHNYPILRFEYLQGADDDDIFAALVDFEQIRLFQTVDARVHGQREFDKLVKIYNIPKEYPNIQLEEVQIRLLNNYLYDQINMGNENFINTVFAYLLGRTPTQYELAKCHKICNNQEQTLFFKKASSRDELLNVLVSNDNYYEYQVKFWYEKIYFKEPNQTLINYILSKTLKNFHELNLKNILVTILSDIDV